MLDKIEITLAILLVIAGVSGFYYLGDSATIVRVSMVLLGLILGFLVFWLSHPGKQFYGFSQESIAETKKVVWPTRKETLQTTAVVFAFAVAMAVFLWLVDTGLLWAVKILLNRSE